MKFIVIATYNESVNGPLMAREATKAAPDAQVLFVDDNSPDGTAQAIEALGLERVRVLVRRDARGYGTAVRDGLLEAMRLGAERIVTMDCDFSHEPSALPAMFSALDTAQMAVGSRYVGGVRVMNWSMKRLLLSAFANEYVRRILGLKQQDCTSGYRAYRAELLRRMRLQTLRSNGYSFLVEMLYRASRLKAKIVEVPITFIERREGESKMSSRVIRESAMMPWLLRLRG